MLKNAAIVLTAPSAAAIAVVRLTGPRVPPFLAHEGAILALVGARDPSLVRAVLGADRGMGSVLLGGIWWITNRRAEVARAEAQERKGEHQ